jgi:hypothetical protein
MAVRIWMVDDAVLLRHYTPLTFDQIRTWLPRPMRKPGTGFCHFCRCSKLKRILCLSVNLARPVWKD